MLAYACVYVFVFMFGDECVWAMPAVRVPMLSNDSYVLFVGVGL